MVHWQRNGNNKGTVVHSCYCSDAGDFSLGEMSGIAQHFPIEHWVTVCKCMEDHIQLTQELLHSFGIPPGISVFVKSVSENWALGQTKATTSLPKCSV